MRILQNPIGQLVVGLRHSTSASQAAFSSFAALALSLLAAGALVGCGGDDEGGAGDATTGNDNIDIGSGANGDGDGGGLSGPQDGGRVDLTNEEVDNIAQAACTGWAGEGENLPAVLQLVVDVSRSMRDDAPGSNRSKWDETRDALEDAIATMPASVSVGVLFYPNQQTRQDSSPSPVDACVNTDDIVPIAMLGGAMSNERATIIDALNQADIDSYTPTYDAYTHALNESLLPYQTSSNKFMLLITDGAPTVAGQCVDVPGQGQGPGDAPTEPIISEIEAALSEHNVRTFLIGSPGSEESSGDNGDMRPWLSQGAVVGGTAQAGCQEDGPEFCHLDMTQEPDFAQALSTGLANIAGQIIDSCTFKVPTPPSGQNIDPNKTNLIVRWGDGNASLILQDNVDDCGDGWEFNAAGDVVLCGETCNEVKLDAQASVSLTFGCGTDELGIPVK